MKLKGPETRSRASKPAYLIILFHGYGQNGDQILDLFGHCLHEQFPLAYVFAPNAPDPTPDCQKTFDWIKYEGEWLDEKILEALNRKEHAYNLAIDQKLKELGLGDESLILVGFSQGARLILHLAFKRKHACAGVLAFGGKMTLPTLHLQKAVSWPPVCLIHGSKDKVVSVAEHAKTVQEVVRKGGRVTNHLIKGMGHDINEEASVVGARFIKSCMNAND